MKQIERVVLLDVLQQLLAVSDLRMSVSQNDSDSLLTLATGDVFLVESAKQFQLETISLALQLTQFRKELFNGGVERVDAIYLASQTFRFLWWWSFLLCHVECCPLPLLV